MMKRRNKKKKEVKAQTGKQERETKEIQLESVRAGAGAKTNKMGTSCMRRGTLEGTFIMLYLPSGHPRGHLSCVHNHTLG